MSLEDLLQRDARERPDPETYKWQGVAAHGNTPFSMMLISHIEGNLWMGGCIHGLKLADDFEYVVSLYPWEQYNLGPDTERIEIKLYDAEMDDPDKIREVASQALGFVMKGKTLIHCQAGLNRSGLISALALYMQGRSMSDSIALLRERRSPAVLCNPYFEEFLLSL